MGRWSLLVSALALAVALPIGLHLLGRSSGAKPLDVRSTARPAALVTAAPQQDGHRDAPSRPVAAGGAAPEAESGSLARDFTDRAARVLGGRGFTESPTGFRAKTRGEDAAAETGELSKATEMRLELPTRGDGTARLSLPSGLAVELHERGADGPGWQIQGAVAYPRSGGTSYWRTTDSGFEEWLLLAAAGEGPAAEWEVKGGLLRQDGDGVLVTDSSGQVQLRVTAPRAYGPGGQAARAWLRAEGELLALYTTARGPALVDPLWTTTGNMNTARYYHTATLLPSGQVLVTGGVGSDAGRLDDAELYDPTTTLWTETTRMGTPRSQQTATLVGSGLVLVDGFRGSYDPEIDTFAGLYNPGTALWSPLGSSPTFATERYSHTATLLPSGQVLVAGGLLTPFDCVGPNCNPTPTASCELFDPATGLWSATGPLQQSRYAHTATLLSNGTVLVVGGTTDYPTINSALASVELYNPDAGTWTSSGVLGQGRLEHTATWLPSGKVLVAGGYSAAALPPYQTYLLSAEVYDPVTGAWSSTVTMASAHSGHTATLLASGKVLVVGGWNGVASIGGTAELYDSDSQTWTESGALATARVYHTATALPSGEVLLAGGEGGGATVELYDPLSISSWLVALPPRASHLFAASGGSGDGYVWSFAKNASGGALNVSTGAYTAGPTGNVTDVVLLTDSLAESVSAAVTVTAGVTLVPTSVTLPPKAQQTFQASGGADDGYTWALVVNSSGGIINTTGVYVAGSMGSVADVVGVTDSVGNTATAAVTVTPALAIAPPSVTLAPMESQSFTASGGSGQYAWSFVNNTSGGSLYQNGSYSAGSNGGATDVVEVTDSLGATARAVVTVTPTSKVGGGGCSATGGSTWPFLGFAALVFLVSQRRFRAN
jgi:hypothetical protein